MNESCRHCLTGRRDGNPCTPSACLCRCHRQGVESVEKIDAAIAQVEARKKRLPISNTGVAFSIPLNFGEEFGGGEKKTPRLVKPGNK